MWIDARGAVVGRTAASDPDEVLAQAADLLRQTIASSPARSRPTRVRVATQALADAIADMGPSIEIVCAATPEIDAVAKLLRA
jgi:hypothetical protein